MVYEYNNSGTALANYVLAGNQLIAQTRGTTTKYFLQDGQGSTRGLLSNVANPTINDITDTYSYTAFGELFSSTGTTVNPYRYTGQQFDSSTGLYSLRARYYNPALGRFLSQDTYPVNFGSPVELNRYVYAANRPINLTDPSGHLLIEFGVQEEEDTETAIGVGTVGVFVYDEVSLLYLFPAGEMGLFGALSAPVRIILASIILASVVGPAVVPQAYVSQQTETQESQEPIVLDFGQSDNFEGEIRPLVNLYRGTARVIGVDRNPADMVLGIAALRMPDVRIPEDYDYIQADFGSTGLQGIFAMKGYNQCAVAAYSFWPNDSAADALPNATQQMLCSGSQLMVVSENIDRIGRLARQLRSIAIINGPKPTTRDKLAALGFWSNDIWGRETVQYLLIATKR